MFVNDDSYYSIQVILMPDVITIYLMSYIATVHILQPLLIVYCLKPLNILRSLSLYFLKIPFRVGYLY